MEHGKICGDLVLGVSGFMQTFKTKGDAQAKLE
jgi:hypothetical protein